MKLSYSGSQKCIIIPQDIFPVTFVILEQCVLLVAIVLRRLIFADEQTSSSSCSTPAISQKGWGQSRCYIVTIKITTIIGKVQYALSWRLTSPGSRLGRQQNRTNTKANTTHLKGKLKYLKSIFFCESGESQFVEIGSRLVLRFAFCWRLLAHCALTFAPRWKTL